MLTKPRKRQQGVTLLELMITVVIGGVLLAVAVPQLTAWVQRNSVSTAAEIVQNGLRQAEAEAIRRNARVEFLLTSSTPAKSGIGKLAASLNGKNWAVRVLDSSMTPLADDNLAYVNAFSMSELSPGVTIEGPASVVFSGTGRVSDIKGVAITAYQVFRLTREGADRAICVFVTPGGAVKACDPSLSSGAPFACQPLVSLSQCPKV